MSLWQLGDVFLDTCVRGGLSMLPFEFLSAKHKNQITEPNVGVLVVSEFSSYSRILNGALLVNPWKTDDVVTAIVKALEMHRHEMLSRFRLNYNFLLENAVADWGGRMIVDIETAGSHQTEKIGSDFVEIGFGFDYRVMQFAAGFVALDVDDLVRKYARSTRRLLIFDYGGTLSWTQCLVDDEQGAFYFNEANFGPTLTDIEDDGLAGSLIQAVRKHDGQVRYCMIA